MSAAATAFASEASDVSHDNEFELFRTLQAPPEDLKFHDLATLIWDKGANPFFCIDGKFICSEHRGRIVPTAKIPIKFRVGMEDAPSSRGTSREQLTFSTYLMNLYILGIAVCITEKNYDEAIRRLNQITEIPLREVIENSGPIFINHKTYKNLYELASSFNDEAARIVDVLEGYTKNTDLSNKVSTEALSAIQAKPKKEAKKGANEAIGKALKQAINKYNIDEIKRILASGDWYINDYLPQSNKTALHIAIEPEYPGEKDFSPIVKLLIDAGADPEVVNGRGQTALGIAITRAKAKICVLLLKMDANPKNALPYILGLEGIARNSDFDIRPTYSGRTSWDDYKLSNGSEFVECIAIALAHGCTAEEKNEYCIINHLNGILESLLKDPVLGTAENIRNLISYGAIPDDKVTDYFGRTARQIAALTPIAKRSSVITRDTSGLSTPSLAGISAPFASSAEHGLPASAGAGATF